MTNTALGTKRNCPGCAAHFYDLNKTPARCPKCQHEFDPAVLVRGKKKPAKRPDAEEKKEIQKLTAQKLAEIKKNKDKKLGEEKDGAEHDIEELDDLDSIDDINELSELDEAEDEQVNGDDADDEAIIEELDAGDKSLVGNVEEEEAQALVKEIEEDTNTEINKSPKNKKSVKQTKSRE